MPFGKMGIGLQNGRSSVSKQLLKCTTCRKLCGPAQMQKMADLPEECVTPTLPFTYVGMDVFGPWYIKENRKKIKALGFNLLLPLFLSHSLKNLEHHGNRCIYQCSLLIHQSKRQSTPTQIRPRNKLRRRKERA